MTTDISRIAYADLLRDDSPRANAWRDVAIESSYPYCDLCGRALKVGTTVKAAYAYGDGRLAAVDENLDIDHANVSEILIGNDCAREIPAAYLLDWTIEAPMPAPSDLTAIRAWDTSRWPAIEFIAILDGAHAVARDLAPGLVFDPTGGVHIESGIERVWLELQVRRGTGGDEDFRGGWYSNDGHLAIEASDIAKGEDTWPM